MNLDVSYGITRRLPSTTVARARERIAEALKAEGFGVLTEIDVQATLEKKLGVATEPYLILGACNPKLAHAALSSEPGVGLLLPCNVVVAKDGDDAIVSAASPKAMFEVMHGTPNPAVARVAEEAQARLERAVAAC